MLKKRHCIARTIKNGELCMTDNLLRTMAIITEKTAAENISGMWATVITGMVVVFLILGLLIGLLYIISFFCNLGNKKKNSESAIKAISADFKTEAPAQKKTKAVGISHFDTAVNSENEFTEDANDKY